MLQQLALDRRGLKPYLWLVFVLLGVSAACGSGWSLVGRESLSPMSERQVRAWVSELVPAGRRLYDMRWAYRTQQGGVRGRAAIRFAPPDSIRFDYRGPFGRSGAAVVVGDSMVWAEPEEDVSELIPVAPLFWAAIGIPRDPAPGATVYGRETNGERVWQYALAGDTLTYVVRRGTEYRFQAEMRRLDDLVGTVDVSFADSVGIPSEATMNFPGSATIFQLIVDNVESLDSFDSQVWRRPQ